MDDFPNEGARLVDVALKARGTTPYQFDKERGWTIGQTSKYLRGDRKPDRGAAWEIFQELGIEPPAWDLPPGGVSSQPQPAA